MNGREKYIASKAYRRPVGQFTQQDNVRDFARSGPGQNYFAMQDLHRQAPSFQKGDPRIDELKQRRRLWNRAQKYPAGEILGRTPQDQMEQYRGLSRDLRETAPGAFGQMYPLTSAYHKYTDVGGLTGLALKSGANILKGVGDFGTNVYDSVMEAAGIGGAYDEATPELLNNYAEKTFPFYPQDVHPGTQDASEFAAPIEDVTESDINEIIAGNLDVEPRPTPNYMDPEYFNWGDKYSHEFNPDGTPKDPGFERIPVPDEFSVPGPGEERYEDYIDRGLEEMPEPLPFDDSVREAGIASLYGQGPQWGETNRRYEGEYRDHIERTGDRMTYEEFERAWERIHQGKPHKGLR